MDLKEILKGIPFREEWQNRYHYFIPLFINNATRFDKWQDWDQHVFNEFFEKNAGQCVSSLQQGCFTNEDKNKLKQNWSQISPLLRDLALTQNEPNWDLYILINKIIRQFTSQSMQAATNRLIASLQPQFLCTIIAEDHLKVLYKKLQLGITDGSVPKYENGNWFKSSYNILTYFKKQLNDEDSYNIMTYPWQLKEEWMPTGYNKFYDILNEVKQIVDSKYPQFKIEDISPNVSNFLWIADSKDIIGNITAHFEINKNRNNLSVDIHFEGTQEEKNIFHQVIKKLPDKVTWKKWQNSQSLTYDEIYNINDENISEKLVSSLVKINELIGEKVRYILENINTLISQYQVKIKEMNSTIQLLEYKNKLSYKVLLECKTRRAELIAREILDVSDIAQLQDHEQYKIVQFHPSYTYEDFVRGIVAEANGDRIEYKNVNKTISKFAKVALDNFLDSKKDIVELSLEKWIEDEFNLFIDKISETLEQDKISLSDNVDLVDLMDDAFLYIGENWKGYEHRMSFKDIKRAYLDNNITRQDIVKNLNLSGSARQHATYYIVVLNKFRDFLEGKATPTNQTEIKEKKYILVIDEINRANLSTVLGELIYALEYRGKGLDSIYEVEGEQKILLPENLYIIGTMNTADRSVGHIDYAIRRRFAFVDVLPVNLESELKDDFKTDIFSKATSLFIENYDSSIDYSDENVVMKKSEYMTADFDPKDVWLGHSYFIQHYEKNEKGEDVKEKPVEFSFRIKYEIKPILEEYIKDGILKESARSVINSL